MPSLRNIIIFVSIAAILILGYVFLIKEEPEEANLISSTPNSPIAFAPTSSPGTDLIATDFLSMFLNVKNIRLEESIFSDPAFLSLRDSSIVLIPDGSEGRPNPFAPVGFEAITVVPADVSDVTTTGTSTPPAY